MYLSIYQPSIGTFTQLYQMDSLKSYPLEPFIIIHNYRQPPSIFHGQKEHKRHHKDYSNLPHSIIMTRKMVAQQEQKQKEQRKSSQNEFPSEQEERPERDGSVVDPDFFCENDLERGIPVEDVEAEEVAMNLQEVSENSNYTKLERTLLGIGYVGMDDDGWDGRL